MNTFESNVPLLFHFLYLAVCITITTLSLLHSRKTKSIVEKQEYRGKKVNSLLLKTRRYENGYISWSCWILGFFVCIIMIIVSAIKKNGKVKKWGIGIGVCFALFIVGVAISPSEPSATTSKDPAKEAAPAEKTPEQIAQEEAEAAKISPSDKELLLKAYSDFDPQQRTQYERIAEKYAKLTDAEKEEFKANIERLNTEKEAYVANVAEEEKKQAEAKAIADKQAAYQKWVEDQFSAWDGSHIYLVDLLKENLNDPKSFEHVETVYQDNGDHLIVKMTYRAKNAFGGLILQNVTARSDYATNMISIISQND
ncbi:MAG: cell envelope integrity protein TolA [Desulfitobacterium sp.]